MSKNPVGRPRTTTDDLPKDWQNIMRECGQEGGSGVEARALLGIGESAWYTLMEDCKDFRRTEKERQALCQVWWERQGRMMTTGEAGNATVWIFNMKNRFGWRDKQDIDHTTKGEAMQPTRIVIETTPDDNGYN